ncbi:hypothetical protein RND81_01G126600 [Saponaria officinalis]|uniref:Replication factor A C-terminal domain-containing protein n=1 Tax=Saponaria officinalis TaxID=3572 RepID=A0AAW1NER9_SAPOF
MRIELLDHENQSLVCTLWEQLADDVTSFISKCDQSGKPHIVIIRYVKIKSFKDLTARRTIDEIKGIHETGYFVILATIKGFDTEYRWFVESCKTCRASVELDDQKKWICTGECNSYAKFVVLRYKVRVRVYDHIGHATFVLFDSQATKLIKQSAKDIRDNQIKNSDLDGYPSELNVLLGRKFIFKIKVDEKYNLKMGWDSYGVNKLSENKDLIEKFITNTKLFEENCLEVDSREESIVHDDKGKESIQSTCESESATSSWNITPSKRPLAACEDDAQLSTTKKHMIAN